MKKLIPVLSIALVAILGATVAIGFVGVQGASAGPETKFDYLIGGTAFGFPDGTCGPFPADFCITSATSFFGEQIEIQGSGELDVKGKGAVSGKGFWRTDGDGGRWKAKKLLMFDSYGPGDVCCNEPVWRSGRALILIELSGSGGKRSAVLEVGCRLDGDVPNDGLGVGETIEGVRLTVEGGLNYNIAADPSITVFIAK